MLKFLTRSRGFKRFDWTDWLSYLYLSVGLFTMFAPILWLVMSSFKTEAAIGKFHISLTKPFARRKRAEEVHRLTIHPRCEIAINAVNLFTFAILSKKR